MKKKRVLSLLLVLCLTLSVCVAAEAGTPPEEPAELSATVKYDKTCSVPGGMLYFESSTGTITDCKGEVTEVDIPATIDGVSVTAIGDSVFLDHVSLTGVTIPDGVTRIGRFAFQGCTNLVSVTIPTSVTTIGGFAFYECSSLPDITIPNGVTTIDRYAFNYCDSLTGLNLPASVTTLGIHPFAYCDSLTEITVDEGNAYFTSVDGVLFNKSKDKLICYPGGRSGEYAIPDGVVCVAASAFCSCSGLAGVTIPDSVVTMEGSAFYGAGLTDITIPAGVKTIGANAFSNCQDLREILVDADNADYSSDESGVLFNKEKTELIRCPGGTVGAYTIPDSVTTIAARAFDCCAKLTGVVIPSSVTKIGNGAFEGSGLTEVVIPGSITEIGFEVFSTCIKLTRVTIPDSVTAIGDYAFFFCTSLAGVTIPDSVTSIGSFAFCHCTDLASLTIPSSVLTIGTSALSDTPNLIVYGLLDSVARFYCDENNIPFLTLDAMGRMGEGEKSLTWTYLNSEDEPAIVSISAENLSEGEIVLAACYDAEGKFLGVQMLTRDKQTGKLSGDFAKVKLFWLNDRQAPLAPSVEAWK